MSINWLAFTPWTALLGGVLIGVAASMLLWLNGRILGVSGIVGNLMASQQKDGAWRWAWLVGVLLSPYVFQALGGQVPVPEIPNWIWVVVAGLIVGVGTSMGSGCTSGHGVCGLARLSRRSLVAVLCFMTSGFVTVYVLRHVL
ncbi:YeeE/YedE family protein [Alcaligenes endophyticus]|uniref:YeeE/YedE family protein n=1 Tax=Alcaligenes endophyticus TaxID=1929088 RepID=A0ABT8ELE0_9BURK|nr:YeeE/YedE family protein [Alcaligenes endophyticus]MCX5590522.1 YeeE/YedE family protein [Alcaligenes endophyticus]MDN4122114.1 YeeE/YedE family protein [Alcaligenes endophyticus]